MTCTYCGTELPRGALFCGECGRRVAPAAEAHRTPAAGQHRTEQPTAESNRAKQVSARPANITRPDPKPRTPSSTADLVETTETPTAPPPPAPELKGPPTPAPIGSRMPSALSLDDPAVSGAVVDRESASEAKAASGAFGDSKGVVSEGVGPKSVDSQGVESAAEPRSMAALVCEQCGAPLARGDIFCGECGFVSRAVSDAFTGSVPTAAARAQATRARQNLGESAAPPAPAPAAPAITPFVSKPAPMAETAPFQMPPPVPSDSGAIDDALEDDVEETRIVQRTGSERFVLQFSTGESVTAYGTGLIGRNPRPEPGEFFDQLVRVFDAGRSVSKTHLEFGQDGGVLWITDRHSGNGTVIREPDTAPQRCEPEKRYRVARGSRVEIGEQFFVVS